MKLLRVSVVLLVLVSLIFVSRGLAQNFEVPLTATDGSNTFTLYLGVLSAADICINPADEFNGHFEQFLPPPPPGGVFDTRFAAPAGRPAVCYDQGSPNDFRPYFNSTQLDTFRTRLQLGSGTAMTVSWGSGLSAYFTSMTGRYFDGNQNVNFNMLTSTGITITEGFGATGDILVTIFTAGPQPPPNLGPCLSLSPSPVDFGNVNVGNSSDVPVTALNVGTSNALNITGASSDNPAFSVVSGVPGVVPASGSAPITVRFTPAGPGLASGNITLTHDPLNPQCGGGSSTVLAVSGVGVTLGGILQFSVPAISRCDDENGYGESLELASYAAPTSNDHLKALQLWIVMPTGLLNNLGGVSRGSAIPSPAWNFSHVVYEDNGTGQDTAKIVIFGNGSNALGPSNTARELVRFNYGTANINGPSLNASIMLANVLGATRLGTNAGVTPGPDQVVTVVDRIDRGDVNADDVLDVLDLLLIVDHILNVAPLTGSAFTAADIAPWPAGDGSVDVLDLALLQNIILSGEYPTPLPCPFNPQAPGRPVVLQSGSSLSKLNSATDVKLTFHITDDGIAVRMENAVAVKGLDFTFGSVPTGAPDNFTTLLGGGYSGYDVNSLLRVLMYDQEAGHILGPGERLVANLPFSIGNPEEVTLESFVVADPANHRIERVEIEIVNGPAPELPTEYILHQNYPNPFNPTTYVKFTVPESGEVTIKIYDMLGKEVGTLFSGYAVRGTSVVEWDGRDNKGVAVSSGIYVYRMTAGKFVQSRKMILMK